MADIIGDGKEAWWWLPSCANIAAPTLAEIAAGVRVSQWMTKDGATGFAPATADAPTSGIESTFDTNVNGRRSFSDPTLTFRKQSGSDVVYTTLTPDAEGFLMRRKSLKATVAAASAQPVQVFPVMCGETAWMDVEDNMPERFKVPVKITAQPNLRAVIA